MGTATEQGNMWGARARDFAEANEPAWTPVFSAALDAAGAGPGTRLLDIGCGTGGALVLARQRGAEVAGLDAAASSVGIARQRLPGAQIEVGEMEELPFASRSFDIAMGINSFQFAGNIVNALAEAGRVVRGGGTVAMLVWGRREDSDLLSKVMPAVFALLPPPPADAPKPMPLAEPGAVEKIMEEAGLLPKDAREFAAALEFPTLDVALRAIMSAAARAIRHAGEDRVRQAVEGALQPAIQPDGTVRLDNRFRIVAAERR